MAENSLHSSLLEIFPESNKEIWKQTASKEIEGNDPFESLSWKSRDGIIFFPYYENADGVHHQYLKKFQLAVGEDSFSGPRRWWNVPRVSVSNVSQANISSLEHLSSGADGILFQINASVDPKILLENIEWQYCALFFDTNNKNFSGELLPSYIITNKLETDSLTGALFWDSIPKKSEVDFYLNRTPRFKSLGFIIKPASPVQEIAAALIQGVNCIEALKSTEAVSRELFNAIAFSISIDTSFFESIAKLKALRLLWYQIAQAYRVKTFHPSDLHIHVSSTTWISEAYEPHGNLIKSTTASMAAIMGGCDSLTVIPQDEKDRNMNRMARNISSLLREESHMNKVSDPIAGSYAVDVMTDEIARQAWKLFQSKMK